MVCCPCFVIPLILWIFYRFIQPLVNPLLPERVKSWLNFNMRNNGVTPPKSPAEGSEAEDTQLQNGTGKEKEHYQESTMRNCCPFKPDGVQLQATSVGGDKKTD